MIHTLFTNKEYSPHKKIAYLSEGLNNTSSAKLFTHIYETILLQEELYSRIQNVLQDDNKFAAIATDANKLNLQDLETRKLRGFKFKHIFESVVDEEIQKREQSKSNDSLYERLLEYPHLHSHITHRKEFSFGDYFIHGIGDGG